MKLMTAFISLHLFSLCAFVCADLDGELRKSIDIAMKCQYREPPKGPVMAVTPSRFAQIVVLLHERFKTPFCFKTSKTTISVNDESSWPFCIFGKCIEGRCQCAGHFSGSKCHIYRSKCWLMYCYLTSCHPVHQSLHCICDPSLYGTKIITGIYWYEEGQSSKFVLPPPGWEDEPTGLIQLKSDAAIKMGSGGSNENDQNGAGNSFSDQSARGSKTKSQSGGLRNQAGQSARGSKTQSQSGGLRNQDSSVSRTSQRIASSGQHFGGKRPGLDSAISGALSREKTDENAAGETKNADVEEALEELEDVSSVSMLKAFYINLILAIINLLWI